MNEPLPPAVKSVYTCSACQLKAHEDVFIVKVISILWREKHETIQAYKQVRCPQCMALVTIIFETISE